MTRKTYQNADALSSCCIQLVSTTVHVSDDIHCNFGRRSHKFLKCELATTKTFPIPSNKIDRSLTPKFLLKQYSRFLHWKCLSFITFTKLRQGNVVFTPVCHSVQGGSLSRLDSVWGSLSRGGLCPWGLCPGGFCPGVSVQNGLCLGDLCQGDLCPGGVSVLGSLSRRSLSRGVSVQGVSVQGVSVLGGSLSGRPSICLREGGTPPTGMHSCYQIKTS